MAGPSAARVNTRSLRSAAVGLTPATTATEPASSPGIDSVDMGSGEVPHAVGNAFSEDSIRRPSQDSESPTIGSNANQSINSQPSIGEEAIALGAGVKEAITVVAKLQNLGLDQYDIPLPKCVVLGDQSTGKSSVIEAISGIKTPRATDTCTRCPLFIKMEPAKDSRVRWKARVFLRSSFVYDPKRAAGQACRFPGWIQGESREIEFATTDDPDKLEELIARAQLAILSGGSLNPQSFLHSPLGQLDKRYRRADFSPNCVCIYISHAGIASLSFYDLPGIIGQSENPETHFLVAFVRNLVAEYVQDEESLILVTCSLENDIHNSTAAGIARDLGATERCVGVLTKPDRLPAGSRVETIQAILNGRSFKLGHDYFVVKNLGQKEIDRGLTNRDARAEEEKFFATVDPWATNLQQYKGRFGTAALQAYLSDKLAAQTLRALPIIRDRINERLESVLSELEQIPEPPTHNAMLIVTDLLRKFAQNIEKDMEIDGTHEQDSWRNEWKKVKDRLNSGLSAMKPALKPGGALDANLVQRSKGGTQVDCIIIDSDDDNGDNGDNGDASNVGAKSQESPSKKRKVVTSDAKNTPKGKQPTRGSVKTELRPKLKPGGKDEFVLYRTIFNLDEIALRIKNTSKSRIPDGLQPKVLDQMIIGTLQHWGRPVDRFFLELEKQLKDQLRDVFDNHFNKWRDAELYAAAWQVVETLVQSHLDEQRHTMAPEALRDELSGPYIYYEDVWEAEKSKTQETYAAGRIKERTKRYFDECDSITGKTTGSNEREKLAQKDEHHSIIFGEPYKVEVEVASKITSYYNIASRRLHDSICMRVESKLFNALRTDLFSELANELTSGPQGHDNCVRLLAENSARETRRRELIRAREQLRQGLQELEKLGKKYHDASINGGDQQSFNLPFLAPTVEQDDLMVVE